MTNPTTLFRSALVRADEAGRTVHGLGVPYGVVSQVDDGYGVFKERFVQGVFARSIRERGGKVRLLANHDRRSFPVGRASELVESAAGLHVAFVVADTAAGNDALELVRSGTVDSFSVGFKPIRDRREGDVVVRTEAALMEVSLTAFPSYEGAAVAGVRSADANRLSVEIARRRLDLLLGTW